VFGGVANGFDEEGAGLEVPAFSVGTGADAAPVSGGDGGVGTGGALELHVPAVGIVRRET